MHCNFRIITEHRKLGKISGIFAHSFRNTNILRNKNAQLRETMRGWAQLFSDYIWSSPDFGNQTYLPKVCTKLVSRGETPLRMSGAMIKIPQVQYSDFDDNNNNNNNNNNKNHNNHDHHNNHNNHNNHNQEPQTLTNISTNHQSPQCHAKIQAFRTSKYAVERVTRRKGDSNLRPSPPRAPEGMRFMLMYAFFCL